MKLAPFVIKNLEAILSQWETFANTLLPAIDMPGAHPLRNDAREILQAAAESLGASLTGRGESAGFRGLGSTIERESVATLHGTARYIAGFNIEQIVAEYRILRMSALQLWKAQLEQLDESAFEDMARFSDVMDQALEKSIQRFSGEVSQSQNTFLAILGHDLRNPLNAIKMAGELLVSEGISEPKRVEILARMRNSAGIMTTLIRDLLDYSKTRLKQGMPIDRESCNVGRICESALAEVGLAHPDCQFYFQAIGNLDGIFDSARLHQVFTNLVCNAVEHGEPCSGISLSAVEERKVLIVKVTNHGLPIPKESLPGIFEPLMQLSPVKGTTVKSKFPTNIGLGLFIAKEITIAHGGGISVTSGEVDGTVFTVTLPKFRNPEPSAVPGVLVRPSPTERNEA